MIPRILVPIDARLPAAADTATQRRRPTTMDERTLVPAMLPIVKLDGATNIPTNLPLESIAARVVVPRDIKREAYSVVEDHSAPLQPTEMDSRIAVPQGSAPLEIAEKPVFVTADLVEPDVFSTGEVHFVAEPPPAGKSREDLLTRVGSIALHIFLIVAILLQAKLFPPHQPTADEQEIARRQFSLILPPGAFETARPEVRPTPPAPKVHVNPKVLREVAPPVVQPPTPTPVPERPKELPSAPAPKVTTAPPVAQPDSPVAKPDSPKPGLILKVPDAPVPQSQLKLPASAVNGSSIADAMRPSNRPSGPRPIVGGGQVHPGRSQGGGGGTAFGGIEMLTPTQGVDFDGYLQRVYFTVKRNWFAVMPESVELGEKGIVVLVFRINRDGSVSSEYPMIQRNSGKEPLDRAAYSSVRASSPFENLPPQFSGPYIELRYTYFYNIDPNSVNQ
jgi:outer membrane biosynthesis protein TonB